jgi:phage terminase small subunit
MAIKKKYKRKEKKKLTISFVEPIKKLTAKEEKFCNEYLIDLNATQAAIRAGYSKKSACSIGAENLRKPHLKKIIDYKKLEIQVNIGVSAEMVAKELAKIAFFDPRMLFNSDGSAKPLDDIDDINITSIAGIEIEELYEGFGRDRKRIGRTKKFKLADKIAALEKLGKHLGMFVDYHKDLTDKPIHINITNCSLEEAAAAYKEALKPRKNI